MEAKKIDKYKKSIIGTISIVSIAIVLVVVSLFVNNPIFDEGLGFFGFFIAPGAIASLVSIDIVNQNKLKEKYQ